jgi:hypothetical protein
MFTCAINVACINVIIGAGLSFAIIPIVEKCLKRIGGR